MASYNYIDVYAVKMESGVTYLAQAPWRTHIICGDIVETDRFKGTVVAKWDVDSRDDEVNKFLKALAGIKENEDIPRIRHHIKYINVFYEDEEYEEDDE